MTGKVPTIGAISGIQDLLMHMDNLPFAKSSKAHLRLWFRGQANVTWKLEPGVYRNTFPVKDEGSRLNIERQMSQDFRVQSAGMLTREANEAELYFLQQHYKLPTRLLDWSGNPLAALYFAVKEEKSHDGYLYVMDAFDLGPHQKAKYQDGRDFQGVATSRNPLFKEALQRITRWSNEYKFPDFVLPVRPDHFDKRMMLQKSFFTFHIEGHSELTNFETKTLKAFTIPAVSKQKIKSELFLLGVDEFSVFGDLDSLSLRLKAAHDIK